MINPLRYPLVRTVLALAAALLFAWLATSCATPAYAQSPPSPAPDYRFAHAAAIAAAADVASTWGGVERGCLSGERNARYWTSGDYTRPDYRQMTIEAAVQAGAMYLATHLTRGARPWLRNVVRGLAISVTARRGYTAYRNTSSCAVRSFRPVRSQVPNMPAPTDLPTRVW